MVWTSSIFDYFLYLQPNRVFSNNLISTKLFVKKQATYYCVFFVARHPQYWSLYGESWLINTSSIFIIVAGLVSGPLIGFCTSLLISVHYVLFIHTKAALVSGCFFLVEGLLAGLLSHWFKQKKELLPHAIGVSFIFASSHIILLALFCYPHTFTPSIEDCALQVMITTALGTGCFIGLIMDSYKQKDILEGLAAKIALNVTNS